ncbi:MAG: hypothetical protein MJ237_02910 [bacterium]|nr:hypothetical protein [bacterium]
MKITGIREGFLKIESEKCCEVSSFLKIDGLDKSFIAQIMQRKISGTGYVLYAKILFLYMDGLLCEYDKTIPDDDAEVTEFSISNICKTFNTKDSLFIGKFAQEDVDIKIDKIFFDNKTLVSVDSPKLTNIIASNLFKQFSLKENVIIVDTLGIIDGTKYVAGNDFKLPLNTDSLKFMYSDCLNDATQDSKNLIKEIFQDLSEYSETVDFLPFDALKTIVDDMVDNNHIFKLLVLKNKLEKFKKSGYFASNVKDAENLKRIISSGNVILDLSKLDSIFQNRYLNVIYSELAKLQKNIRVVVLVSNYVNKQNLKTIMMNELISSVFITHSNFKYINEIKQYFTNYIIEPTLVNKNTFELYSLFLSSTEPGYFLVVGEGTNYIPIITKPVLYALSAEEEYYISKTKQQPDKVLDEISNNVEIYESFSDNQKVTEANPTDGILSDVVDNLTIDNAEAVITEKSDKMIDEISQEIESVDENSVNENLFDNDDELEDGITQEKAEIFENPVSEMLRDEYSENQSDDSESLIEVEEIMTSQETDEVPLSETESVISKQDEVSINEDYPTVVDTTPIEDLSEAVGEDILVGEAEKTLEEQEDEIEIPDSLSEDIEEITLNHEYAEEKLEQQYDENDLSIEILEENDEQEFISKDSVIEDLEEITELDPNDFQDGDTIVEMDDVDISILDEQTIEQNISEDVDTLYTTIKDDTISDSDLDFIDQLNEIGLEDPLNSDSDNDTLSEFINDGEDNREILDFNDSDDEQDSFLQPIEEISDDSNDENKGLVTKKATTSTVPMYDAEIPDEDKVQSDYIEQGDTVVHAKYGSGIVEKMIKYGNKNLYSINFDKVGRRLLDPTLTELKKA